MNSKYFTVNVNPGIPATRLNGGALADDDVIFSWTPFEIPKGSAKLLNVTAMVASNDGTAQHLPFQLFFAKGVEEGGLQTPTSIGTFNTPVLSQPSINQHLGGIKINAGDYMCQSLIGSSIATSGTNGAEHANTPSIV